MNQNIGIFKKLVLKRTVSEASSVPDVDFGVSIIRCHRLSATVKEKLDLKFKVEHESKHFFNT